MPTAFSRFIGCLLASTAVGLSIRIAFSPERINQAIIEALGPEAKHVVFSGAELRLRRGLLPALFIRVHAVRLKSNCPNRVALHADYLDAPIRLSSIVSGGIPSAGIIDIHNLVVDVDAARDFCAGKESSHAVADVDPASKVTKAATLSSTPVGARVWWSNDDAKRAFHFVQGVRIDRAVVKIPSTGKSFEIEGIEASTSGDNARVRLNLQIPSALTYGNAMPPVTVEGEVDARAAVFQASLAIDEGVVRVHASAKPDESHGAWIELHATASGIPASALAKYILPDGAARFHPRALWFSCSATAAGPIHDLLGVSPIDISGCMLDGDAGKLAIDSVRRLPGGGWTPFTALATGVDLKALLESIGMEGPTGIFSDFGRLEAKIDFAGVDAEVGLALGDVRGHAALEGAKAIFMNGGASAVQEASVEMSFERRGRRASGTLEKISIKQGKFDGSGSWNFDSLLKSGSLEIEARCMDLSPEVQKIMLGGTAGRLGFSGELRVHDRKIQVGHLHATVEHIDSPAARTSAVSITSVYANEVVRSTIKAPRLWLPMSGEPARLLAQAFPNALSSVPTDGWMEIRDASVQVSATELGLDWSNAQLKLTDGNERAKSNRSVASALVSGHMDRQQNLAGVLITSSVREQPLRFAIGGSFERPTLALVSKVPAAPAVVQ